MIATQRIFGLLNLSRSGLPAVSRHLLDSAFLCTDKVYYSTKSLSTGMQP